jgi:thiol-disulfide isomerase/thioredoxin
MKQLLITTVFMVAMQLSCETKGQGYAFGDTIALPLEYHSGFGPFLIARSGIGGEDNQKKGIFSNTYLAVKGIPASWKDPKKQMIIIDYPQFLYQNTRNGNITKSQLVTLKDAGWNIDSSSALPSFIKCYVYVAMGTDEHNRMVAIVDQNNNLDFSDDLVLFPKDLTSDKTEVEKNIVYAQYERNQYGKKHIDTIPILLSVNKGYLQYSIPRYATAILKLNNKSHHIVAGAQMSISGTFSNTQIALWNGHTRELHPDSTVKKGEVLIIGDEAYENLGVNIAKNHLLLRKRKDFADIVSASPGYKAIQFEGTEFTSNKTISLDSYRGKYVYIDFWGTWCGPCIAELPALKKLYSSTKRDKIEFIGIAVDQKPELLESFLKKQNITWPQIISNDIADMYKVTYMPTTFLIGPDGRIIAKDLKGEDLHKKLEELLRPVSD